MAKILLASDPAHPRLELLSEATGNVLVVHHKAYTPPRGPSGTWETVVFDEMRESSRDWLARRDTLVFVGLSRAITPGNRVDMVWEILYNKTAGLTKISLDRTLFVSEPWRAWFPFGFVNARYRDYAHSFVAETQFNQYIDGMRTDDPFSVDELLRWSRGVVASDYPRWFGEVEIETVATTAADKADYAKLKQRCFDEERSPKRIVARLEEFAASVCPQRLMPAVRSIWGLPSLVPIKLVSTDLPVDRWLTSRILYVVNLTNTIAEACHVRCD